MKFRRRYQVVVEGVSGQAVAQRSVISEHRSEAEAREAAALERRRLEVIHGGGARSWRILVTLDDQIVAEEVPEADGEDLLRAATRPPTAPVAPPPDEPAADEGADEAADAPEEPAEPPEPPPEGPVPDWVLRRFEESIERRGEREEHGPDDEQDGAAQPLP